MTAATGTTSNKIQLFPTQLHPISEDSTKDIKFSKYNFSPRRFNRYPRFTIFLKKGDEDNSNKYIMENTVSLNPQFLTYLMESQLTGNY